MIPLHRVHFAAVTLFPCIVLTQGLAMWSSQQHQQHTHIPTSTFQRQAQATQGALSRLRSDVSVVQKTHKFGDHWRWVYGQRNVRRKGVETSSGFVLWDPSLTPEAMSLHPPFKAYAQHKGVYPQIPVLSKRRMRTVHGTWSPEWSFLPRETLKAFGRVQVSGDVLFGKKLAYVAYIPRHSTGGDLYAVDLDTGEPVWRAGLYMAPLGVRSGWFEHRVRLHQEDGLLVVTANTTTAGWIQKFDSKTGQLITRTDLPQKLFMLGAKLDKGFSYVHYTHALVETQVGQAGLRCGASDHDIFYGTKWHDRSYIRTHDTHQRQRQQVALDTKISKLLSTSPRRANPETKIERREVGKLLWSLNLSHKYISNIVSHNHILYLVGYERDVHGGILMAIDERSGKMLWGSALRGVGVHKESATHNMIRLTCAHGHLVVTGHGQNKSFLEAIHPATGETVMSKVYLHHHSR